MRIAIVHFSDVHIKTGFNPVIARCQSIAAAISSSDPTANLFLIVVSGDIAYSGSAEEYKIAHAFFREIEQKLREFRPGVEVRHICIPGNHDCTVPEDEENLRDVLIAGLLQSFTKQAPDKALLEQVRRAQKAYEKFRSKLMDGESTWDGICQSTTVEHNGKKLQFNLYNTALLSRRKEKQGTLHVPTGLLREKICLQRDAALCISVFHHSYVWLESNTMVDFRSHLETTCDVALTGHQHYSHDFYKENSTGEKVLYIEAPALQDMQYPQKSAFRVLIFDLQNSRQQSIEYRWNNREKIYRATATSDWRSLTINRAIRAEFRLTEGFESFLHEIGTPVVHPRKGNLNLRDIFVFPDLRVRSTGVATTLREVRGENLVEYALSAQRVIFQASSLGGKTSLAKMLVWEMLRTSGTVPLLVNGREIHETSDTKLERYFWKKFSFQYNNSMLDAFLQTEKEKRVLIVDDWHRAGLNSEGRGAFLEVADQCFGKIFLFVDDFFPLQELIEGSATTLLEFEHASIEQFRHALRGRIIDRWVTLGQEHTAEGAKISREIEEKENLVRGLIGKNILPSRPFVVLCILEADQEGKAQSSEAGSFGYLYEVLVTTALNATKGPKAQLEKKYIFLARLAYRMFKLDVDVLSGSDVRGVAEEYSKSHLVKVDIDAMLDDLEDARVLRKTDGNYSFAYRHFFYYFVARYYKDNLDRDEGPALREELAYMADYLSSNKFAAILMFVIYFCRDSAGVIKKLVENASRVFPSESRADLDVDVEFLNQFCDSPSVNIPEEVDITANRKLRREALDKVERGVAVLTQREERIYSYSEELSDKEKFDLAHKHVELLGQVIRNFPGSLPGPEKLAILDACYSLGLRVIRAVLRLIESSTALHHAALANAKKELEAGTLTKIRETVDAVIILMARLCVLSSVKHVSASVGIADLEEAYRETLAKLGKTNATQLIHLSIKLDHFAEFPDTYIRELHRAFSGNAFAATVLSDLVVSHMLVFDLDRKTRQSMGALFKLKQNLPQLIDPNRKR